ncbi:MAG: PAS domain S-box protein [Candidatus Electronema sp. V4]|uniref:PAS domain S-box protein n=1 Tax=Candidatus Electronema sp. V4 TaxID=3454756 RepID=UPI00405597B2
MQQTTVPFYRRLRFSMIMTVLLLVTMISGTSILISYHVTGQKIERDMGDDFLSAEMVVETYLTFSLRQLQAAAEELARHRAEAAPFSAAEDGRRLSGSGPELVFFLDSQGDLAAVPEQSRATAGQLAAQPVLREQLGKKEPFSLILLAVPESGATEQKKIFLIRGLPLAERQEFVLCAYLLDNAFLSRLPLHRRMGVSLVSDNNVLASTLPPELYSQDPLNYRVALLPGALDKIYESSFFAQKMYLKSKYIPHMKNSPANLLVLSHPAQLILATDKEFGQHFFILFFVGLCSSLILVVFITGSVLNPINQLQRLVLKISSGDLSGRIDTSVNNEFTLLITQFNRMLDLIKKKDDELAGKVEVKTKELQQQNILIDSLLCSSQVMAIAATDMERKITYFNPVAERIFGYKAGEVINRKVDEFKERINQRADDFTRLIAQAQEKGSHTFTIGTADGISYDLLDLPGRRPRSGKYQQTIEVYLSPIRAWQGDEAGKPSGLMLMAQDVTKAREMDERLHAALAELQVIINNTMLGLILVQDDRIVRVNSTFERLFGYRFPDIQAIPWPVFYASIFAGKEAECWDGSGRMFYMVRKADKDEEPQPFWSKVRRVAIDDEQQPELRRELFLFEDMSVQNEMFEKIRRLSQAVEQSSNSVVITDTLGMVEYVNRTFVTLTGYEAEEVIGRNLSSLSPDPAVYEPVWAAVRAGQEWAGELANRKKNGDFYEENVVVSSIRDEQNEITQFVLTKENITDLKRARQQADAANKAKSEFLAKMSHEIRTPMNSIIGMSELLLDTPLQPDQRGYLENVNSSASVLLSLINDILDFSKIEAGRLELDRRPFSLRHLAEEIVATLKILAEQKNIELRLRISGDEDCSPVGDSLRIRQVLLNLVGNAIKFTRKGHVTLEIEVQPVEESCCAADFKIVDTGIGIAKEQQEKIFADFTQADNSITREYGGTGLGLSISNSLLQMMGSKIELDSEPGQGSTFAFSLLLENGGAKAAADMRREAEEVGPVSRRLEILLVEDNPANQQLAVILLTKQGHQVTVASSGAEALVCLSRCRYDLIFMDMQMPVMDGLTATKHIRSVEQGQPDTLPADLAGIEDGLRERLAGGHIYIIAVTANALREDQQQCLDAGMDEYLSKPYKKIALLKVLQTFDRSDAAPPDESPQKTDSQRQEEEKTAAVSLATVKQHIMKQFELEQTDAEEVLAAYAGSLRENIGRLQECLDAGQGVEGGRQAHALKGGLLNLGLEELAKTALALEKELPAQIEERHRRMTEQLSAALRELMA